MNITPQQSRRIATMTEFLKTVQASKDRRKARRWVNQVIRMTRYHVKANGLVQGGSIDTHRAAMKKFRHTLPAALQR